MTIKSQIMDILVETGLPTSYRMSDTSVLPRFSFSLTYNGSERLSNERHEKRMIYQISYYCVNSVEVQDFPLFENLIDEFEANDFTTGDWQEDSNYNVETNINLYHYFMDVTGYG